MRMAAKNSLGGRKRAAMRHPDKLGAGASKRRKLLRGKEKVPVVMHEFGRGTLRSGGSGKKVTKRSQAVAIAMSEAGLSKK
jgi:hypothetical protein